MNRLSIWENFDESLHRPMNKKTSREIAHWVSCVFGLGYLPWAPGTWGSLPGLGLAAAGHHLCRMITGASPGRTLGFWSGCLALIMIAALALGAWRCIASSEGCWQHHDDPRIVVDETLGQMLASIWFVPDIANIVGTFLLFRFFDIAKPGPIGWIDNHMDTPMATLLDDLLAGLLAAGTFGFLSWFSYG